MKTINQNIICQLSGSLEIQILNHKVDYVGIMRSKSNGFYYLVGELYVTYEGGSAGKRLGNECKFICHPLSDLTKPIKVPGHNDGKEFIPIDKLSKWLYDEEPESFRNVEGAKAWINATISLEAGDFSNLPYKVVLKLISWHFAIDIPEGCWVDINTL
jgi:hypothetical protein